MYQHVKFYDNANLGKEIDCLFRSEKTLNRFLELYDSVRDSAWIMYDIIQELDKNYWSLPIIPATNKGITSVYRLLYGV